MCAHLIVCVCRMAVMSLVVLLGGLKSHKSIWSWLMVYMLEVRVLLGVRKGESVWCVIIRVFVRWFEVP